MYTLTCRVYAVPGREEALWRDDEGSGLNMKRNFPQCLMSFESSHMPTQYSMCSSGHLVCLWMGVTEIGYQVNNISEKKKYACSDCHYRFYNYKFVACIHWVYYVYCFLCYYAMMINNTHLDFIRITQNVYFLIASFSCLQMCWIAMIWTSFGHYFAKCCVFLVWTVTRIYLHTSHEIFFFFLPKTLLHWHWLLLSVLFSEFQFPNNIWGCINIYMFQLHYVCFTFVKVWLLCLPCLKT